MRTMIGTLNSIVMEEVRDPETLEAARAQRVRFDRNTAWLQTNVPKLFPSVWPCGLYCWADSSSVPGFGERRGVSLSQLSEGTRRFNSSNQFCTSTICASLSSASGLTIKNRCPSDDTS